MTEVKRKGRPLAHDRDELLRHAKAVAVERGFDALRFTDVAEATGVPVSSLQYAFGTRDELVREVLRAGVAEELHRHGVGRRARARPVEADREVHPTRDLDRRRPAARRLAALDRVLARRLARPRTA